MSAADSTGRRIAAELRKQSANKAVQRPLGFSPLFSAVYGKPRQEQFRFPRSKRWRIRKKWRKDPRNWRAIPTHVNNPEHQKMLEQMLEDIRPRQVSDFLKAVELPTDGAVFVAHADFAKLERNLATKRLSPTLLVGEPPEDLHTKAAAELFQVAPDCITPEMRRFGKMKNYNKHYGISAQELQDWVDKNA